MPTVAQQERAALCQTLIDVGPDAPTLDGDWRARDLAAHLILRERRPDAALGAVLPAFADRTERMQRQLAAKDFAGLVEQIRQGPPVWHPARIAKIDELSNLAEFFVHHEDVLRGGESWNRRELSSQLSTALWGNLPQVARLAMRNVRVGVVADAPGVGRRSIRKPKDAHGSVVLTGAPGEIFLSVFGRDGVAQVTFDGADLDVAAYKSSKRGI